MISTAWFKHWDNLTAFFDFPPEIRKLIYTTNAIESLNKSFRKTPKTKGSLPNDEAVFKLISWLLKISLKTGQGLFLTGP